jgi:hypothetical protein
LAFSIVFYVAITIFGAKQASSKQSVTTKIILFLGNNTADSSFSMGFPHP